MTEDKIIRFPGGTQGEGPAKKKRDKPKAELPPVVPGIDPAQLSEDRRKALQIVLSGMPFVAIGIKTTGGGADFFTAIDGDAKALADALPHLDGVIQRAYAKKGIRG